MRPTLIRIAFEDDTPRSRAAFSILYETYEEPVRAYIRRWRYRGGYDDDQAQDLMHEFFLRGIEKLDLVKNWDPERTRFRSWLFAAINYFLLNKLKADVRERLHVSFDDILHEPSDSRTPERLLAEEWACDWAQVLIDGAFAALRVEYTQTDRIALHDALSPYIGLAVSKHGAPPYDRLSRQLDKSVIALRGDMHRMRRFWKKAVWDLIRETVPDHQVRSELELLISVLESRDHDSLPVPPARRRSPARVEVAEAPVPCLVVNALSLDASQPGWVQ